MTELLHTRLMGYLAKLRGKADPLTVIRDVSLTMAKDIDEIRGRQDAMGRQIEKLLMESGNRSASIDRRTGEPHGEPDA